MLQMSMWIHSLKNMCLRYYNCTKYFLHQDMMFEHVNWCWNFLYKKQFHLYKICSLKKFWESSGSTNIYFRMITDNAALKYNNSKVTYRRHECVNERNL